MGTTRTLRVGLVVGIAFAVLTSQRLALFRQGEIALWENAAAQSHAPRPWINLGNVYHLEGREAEAEASYGIALAYADARRSDVEWRVGGALALVNLGTIYWQAADPLMESCAVNAGSDWQTLWPGLFDAHCVRHNRGRILIAAAHDRWPDSREIQQRFREVAE